ncbi:MAG: dihydrofolate reductase family protein [Verrucomicrobia bacterium]|nr:dihydrofolate reductase family protein [Verrucomicrobiota bacterium]
MRKLIVSSFISLDGVVESPMTWASPFFDEECKEYAYQQLADVEFFLLGRVAYQTFSAVWPQIKGDKYIDRINALKKLVVSRTLKEVAWNASLIAGDAATELAKIKQERGGNIMKYGVTQLDQALLAAKLVDEYELWIMPTRVGEGKRVFADVNASLIDLELAGTYQFKNGVVVLKYFPR